MTTWTHTYDGAQVIIVPADIDDLIEEVFGKPGLGVEDSAGIVDYMPMSKREWRDAETEELCDGMDEEEWIRGGC